MILAQAHSNVPLAIGDQAWPVSADSQRLPLANPDDDGDPATGSTWSSLNLN